MSADAIEKLSKLLEGVPICFCTVCCHDPAYGYCYSCRCANHQTEPIIADVAKLKATLDHWRELAIRHYEELKAARREHLSCGTTTGCS